MNKVLVPIVGALAVVLLVFVAFAGVQGQSPIPAAVPSPTGTGYMTIPGLEGVPPDQLFSHFMSEQINLTDKNGNPMTLIVTPGTVSSASDGTLVITPNGQTTTNSYRITSTTVVHAMPAQGTLESLSPGDQVYVVTMGNSMDAVWVMKREMAGRMGFGHPMFR